ncbi:hypothetical protein DFA_05838 [Cavenderia fasciculata]|uniref:Uncharacterized protein n=1 Tax=Cavenderia fasciculata TaxID=261658 RepID=F4PMW0_CACFS|nr:uncharacterized protein DFA_05838 [Cavenderia fasciculata]EGG23704.1 hypothetical protein DFA_05838 [Cavenderia fasciculata]|eukprot:XP_004361555.1 hypothetical protein DFA_05838 [Cavenderia fasciculata]
MFFEKVVVSSALTLSMNNSNSNNNDGDVYIPYFLKDGYVSSNNSDSKDEVVTKNKDASSVELSMIQHYKKYQSAFEQISQNLQTWQMYEQSSSNLLKSLSSVLERFKLLMSVDEKRLFHHFNNNHVNDNDDRHHSKSSSSSGDVDNDSLIMVDNKAKHALKVEEIMRAILRYNESKRQVINKLQNTANEMESYWIKNCSFTNDQKYFKTIDFNSGTYSTPPLALIQEWLEYIIKSFKLEFQRKDSLILKIDYTMDMETFMNLIEEWEYKSLLDIAKIKDMLVQTQGVISED